MDPQLIRFKNKLVEQGLSEVTIRGYFYDIKHFWAWLKGILRYRNTPTEGGRLRGFKSVQPGAHTTQQHRHKAASAYNLLFFVQAQSVCFSTDAPCTPNEN